MLGPNVDQKTRSGLPTISGLALIHPGVVETVLSQSLVQLQSPIAEFNNVFSDNSMINVDVDVEFLFSRPPCDECSETGADSYCTQKRKSILKLFL